MTLRTLAATTALALGLVLSSHTPVQAQVPPPPPEAAPVFELVAPVVSPVCGNAVVVVALATGIIAGQLGGPLPVDILPLFGPAIVICGSVPAPPQRLSCSADTTVQDTLNTLTGTAAGTQLPVDARVAGPAVEQVVVIQDNLPAPLNTAGLAEAAVTTLQCTPVAEPARPPAPETLADAAEEPPAATEELTDLAFLGVPEPELPLTSLDADGGGSEVGSAGPLTAQPAGEFGGPGFAYPVVFALPLLLLVIGGYLGRALTRPVDTPQR